MERGKAQYSIVAAGSNSTIKRGAGTVYRVFNPSASTMRMDSVADLGANPDIQNPGSTTLAHGVATSYDFGPGVGFDGLSIAATSNARLTVIWE